MAKRFIDTELFEDEWYMDLSKDAKIFWIYCMTKCDHAGILELNEKLCKFQTGIKDVQTVKQELGNRLVTLKEPYIFIPKFLYFQYPNFPNSNVKAQQSAISKLEKFDLIDKGSLTLKEGLGNYYGYGHGNGTGNGNGKGDAEGENLPTNLPEEELASFKEVWLDYLEHRKEMGLKKYKSAKSERIKFNELLELSGNDPQKAQEIVNQSRGNSWQGLFELKSTASSSGGGRAADPLEEVKKWRPPLYVDRAVEQGYKIDKIYRAVIDNNSQITKDGEVLDW